jgi:LCP family protein required for cell wall assembly
MLKLKNAYESFGSVTVKQFGEAVKKFFSSRKRLILSIAIALAVVLVTIVCIMVYRIIYKPQSLFNFSTINPSMLANGTAVPTPAPGSTDANGNLITAAPTASSSLSQADADILAKSDILNILLIGIDRSETVGKLSGNDPHADVMMVLAINFKQKKVDMISLPRDTFVHQPDLMNGVYKLNASFNVGGGFSAPNGGGFLKVCEAAKYMLGGIPVDYYYGVDFTSLVSIVNTLGGVDYDVENRAYSREHVAGMQHMDGDDVLFYVRTRKVGPEQGDVNRVNRQKKMLIAIFNQMMKNGKLSMVPDLLSEANSGIYTNTTLQQTLSLANYAKTIGVDKINMHSMAGDMIDKASWHYCFTDQKDRIELIQQVYGITVPEQVHCSARYSDWLVSYGFSGIRFLKTAKQMLDYADLHKDGITTEQQTAYDTLKESYAQTQTAYDLASLTFAKEDTRTMTNAKNTMKANTLKLAKLLQYTETLKWTYNRQYWNDPDINGVLVDFR